MSEPQHPQKEGTQSSVGQSGSITAANNAAPRAPQAAAGPAIFDSLAAAGARLAQLREAKGWSIDDVSARLKVPPVKMRALEAGDISHLPGTTFALGVVRSYAKMLGVDSAPFAQALRREKGEPEPDLSMPASTGTDLPRGRVSVSLGGTPRHRSWWWGVAAVIVALIALVMWRSGGEPPAWLARLKASANGAATHSSGASTTAQGQTVSSDAAIVAAEAAAAGDNARAVLTPPEAGSGAQAPNATAASAGAVAPPQAAAVATPPQAAAPEASAAAPAPKVPAVAQASSAAGPSQAAASREASGPSVTAGTSTVAFTVTQDSWFSVRDKNGKEVFSGIVHARDTKAVQGEPPFKVVAGNRAGVESITLDGKAVDAAKYATARGNVSRFSLP